MSDADIDKAVKEAAEFEAQDKKRKKRSIQETKLMRWISRQKTHSKKWETNMDAQINLCRS